MTGNVSCDLRIDGTTVATNSSVAANVSTVLYSNQSISDGARNWFVNCTNTTATEQSNTWILNVDTTAPTTTATAVNSTGGSYTFDTWTSSPYVNVTLSCSDAGSGCGVIQYCTDTANTCTPDITYTGVVQISTEGISYIRYRSNDTVGNLETTNSQTIKIDTTAPTVTPLTPADNAWTSDITPDFVFTTTDALSATTDCTLYVDETSKGSNNSVVNNTATTITSSALTEGTRSWYVNCTDSASNVGKGATRTINVDNTNPISLINFPGNNSWTSDTTPEITFTLTDNLGAAINYTIFIDDSEMAGGTGSVANNTAKQVNLTTLTQGTHTVIVQATDNASNSANSSTLYINVDTTNPVASQGTNPIDHYNSSNSTVIFDIKCSDNMGPISHLMLYGNWTGSWHANYTNTSYSNNTWINKTVSGIADGHYVWAVYCNDSAGNSDWTSNRTLLIDATAPIANLYIEDTSIFQYQEITVSCSSDDANIKNVSLTIAGSIVCTGTSSCSDDYKPTTTGTKAVRCTVYDEADNSDTATGEITVTSRGGGGGGGVGVAAPAEEAVPEQPSEAEIDKALGSLTAEGTEFSGGVGDSANFSVKGKNHVLKITEITNNSVTFWIWSNPIKVTLKINETKVLDLDGDGYAETMVTLKSIVNGKANLMLNEIEEITPVVSVCGNNVCEANETQANCCVDCGCAEGYECIDNECKEKVPTPTVKKIWQQWWLWIVIAIVVVALALVIFAARMKRARHHR